MKTFIAQSREIWRNWLAVNHDQETEVWLVYYKKGTGMPCVAYGASVEEALCFGWVDSLIKSLDEESYARKFTPRKEDSNWSDSNKKRVEKMIAQGLMTEHGLRLVEAAKENGRWHTPESKPELTFTMLPEFAAALRENEQAAAFFDSLSATDQKQFLGWMEMAKRPETRAKRIAESIRLLAVGKKLGLK